MGSRSGSVLNVPRQVPVLRKNFGENPAEPLGKEICSVGIKMKFVFLETTRGHLSRFVGHYHRDAISGRCGSKFLQRSIRLEGRRGNQKEPRSVFPAQL